MFLISDIWIALFLVLHFLTNVHLISVLYPSLFNLTSVDMVDEQILEIQIHNGVDGNESVRGEDIANDEIGEATRTNRSNGREKKCRCDD